jgi:leucyl aminopeptidase (aminopeptidase T)
MMESAKTILDDCVCLKRGEKIIILTDKISNSIAKVLVKASIERDAEPIVITIQPRKRDGQEPPDLVAEAMKFADVIICLVKVSITHTNAIKRASELGARILIMTAFTEDMMLSGGVEADFKSQKPICDKLAQLFSQAKELHLANPAGTDLKMNVDGQKGNALTCIINTGEFSTFPTIEANISPKLGSSEGLIVADASVPYIGIGLLKDPIYLNVKEGFITEIKGGHQAEILMTDLACKEDPNVYNIAELGVGLNPKCKMSGIMLDDEGVLGSAHIGIGSNLTLGGNLKAAIHYDLVLWHPTIRLDGKIIIKNGEILFSL